jgi:orotate phosphoribosyltransferase-like protein
MEENKNWVTQKELADELQVSIQKVHNWVRRNNIASKKVKEYNNITLVDKTTINVRKYNN